MFEAVTTSLYGLHSLHGPVRGPLGVELEKISINVDCGQDHTLHRHACTQSLYLPPSFCTFLPHHVSISSFTGGISGDLRAQFRAL